MSDCGTQSEFTSPIVAALPSYEVPPPPQALPRQPGSGEMHDIDGVPGLLVAVGARGRILYRRGEGPFHRLAGPGVELGRLAVTGQQGRGLAYLPGARGTLLSFDGQELVLLPTGTQARLLCAFCPSGSGEVWIGGAGLVLRLRDGVLTHYETDFPVRRIWGAAPDDLWLLGPARLCLRGDGRGLRPQVLRAAGEPAPQAELFDLSGTAPDDVWAVGERGTILRFDGRGLSPVASHTRATLYGICHGPEGDPYVTTSSGQLRRLRDRRLWTVSCDVSGPAPSDWLDGVCAVGDTIWFCGLRGIFCHVTSSSGGPAPSASWPGPGPRSGGCARGTGRTARRSP
jgi:hypothetical protein